MSTTELDRALHTSVMKREAVKEAAFREERERHEEEVKLGFGATEMSKAELRKVIDSDRRMYYRTEELNDKLYIHYKGWRTIQNLEGWTGLKAMYAECNAFDKIQGLQMCRQLRSLFLQENCIRKIEGLENLTNLWNLNLSNNYIEKLEGLKHIKSLNTLTIAKNKLGFGGVEDLIELVSMNVSSLDIQDNKICDPDVLPEVLARMPDLRCLYMKGNAACKRIPNYRKSITVYCENMKYLDDRPVFPEDRRASEAFNRGGLEAERAERRLIKQEEANRHDRNMKAFAEMIDRAKSEKRERDAMQGEDKYTVETDPVETKEKRMAKQVNQWRLDNANDLKDDAKEHAERCLKSEKEQGLATTEPATEEARPEEEETEKKVVDNRKLVYEDIWDDVPRRSADGPWDALTKAPPKPPKDLQEEDKAKAGAAVAERLRAGAAAAALREAAATAAEKRGATASAPSTSTFQPPARRSAAAAASPEASVSGFVHAASFQGAKPGMVFKLGAAGLGYYPDKAAPGAQAAAAAADPGAEAAAAAAERRPEASPEANTELDEMD